MDYSNDFINNETFITKKAIDALPYMVCITNKQGKILYLNKQGNSILKKESIEKVKNAYEFLEEYNVYLEDKKLDKYTFPLYRTLKNGEQIENLILYFKKTNPWQEDKYLSMSTSPLIENQDIIGAIITFYDITKEFTSKLKFKKEREEFLNFSAELKTKCQIIEILRKKEKEHLMHLKDVINNISEGILVFDNKHKLNLCNKSIQKIFHLKAIDFVNSEKFVSKYYLFDEKGKKDSVEKIYKEYVKKMFI
ncbi:sensory histidine kinase AtoS [Clostridium acetireducens DSM 10703]|uniref:Sensory histidine kinase AtoS n=1 Tax=Clostridium acetireducens DSM 10703 TaxID=1121290 RepID=A0A1E8EZT6_9CLOT|nr:PAS domain-containing protein [Clostridium acetireducens]OFI06535.1 sensory histidine kinase AtoS [Clostridium acetireducens DSM 10703]